MGRIRLLVGLIISLSLLFLTFRDLEAGKVVDALRDINAALLVVAMLIMLGAYGVRALRWSYLLRPVRQLPWLTLYPITLIGFFGNYVLPAKTGELVRAYVLGKREQLSKS